MGANSGLGLFAILSVFAALIAFLMSTRQFSFALRLPVWLAGAGFVFMAAYLAFAGLSGHEALGAALVNLVSSDNPTSSVLFGALTANGPSLQRYITPIVDLMIVFAAVLGVFALLALTPGDWMERALVRPMGYGAIGAMVGASLALLVVAVSLGGPVEMNRFVGVLEPASVQDGDTFWVGDVSVRLIDADAPEKEQTCLDPNTGERSLCGEEAAEQLARFALGAIVDCTAQKNEAGRTRESFNRTLARCFRVDQASGARYDIASALVLNGWAVRYQFDDGPAEFYAREEAAARAAGAGMHGRCTLSPKVWRRDAAARDAFEKKGVAPADPTATIGNCRRFIPPSGV